jgi:hypothetical protein
MENKTNTSMGLSPSMGLSEIAAQLGKRGGDKNVANHDHNHFVNLGKQGMSVRWAGHKKK